MEQGSESYVTSSKSKRMLEVGESGDGSRHSSTFCSISISSEKFVSSDVCVANHLSVPFVFGPWRGLEEYYGLLTFLLRPKFTTNTRVFSAHQLKLGWPIWVAKCSPPLHLKYFSFHVICKLSDARIAYNKRWKWPRHVWSEWCCNLSQLVILLYVLGCEPAILNFSLLQIHTPTKYIDSLQKNT